MNNLGWCYPARPSASVDNTLRDLHNSSYDTKAEFINCFIFIQNNSQFKNIAKTCLPPSIHRCLVHLRQCTFRFFQLRKYSPNSRCRPSSCLLAVLPCFQLSFRLVTVVVLTLETSEVPAIFISSTKTTQPRPQVFSVNGVLTCDNAAFLTSFPR